MKIRIKGDTIRLRLSQPEVDQISQAIPVKETTHFGTSELHYCLMVHDDETLINARFEKNQITISINKKSAFDWATSDQVGLETSPNVVPFVLIEKDFQCLTVREREDESQLFANPNTSC